MFVSADMRSVWGVQVEAAVKAHAEATARVEEAERQVQELQEAAAALNAELQQRDSTLAQQVPIISRGLSLLARTTLTLDVGVIDRTSSPTVVSAVVVNVSCRQTTCSRRQKGCSRQKSRLRP